MDWHSEYQRLGNNETYLIEILYLFLYINSVMDLLIYWMIFDHGQNYQQMILSVPLKLMPKMAFHIL